MRLYTGHITEFISDTLQNKIVSKLENAFFDYFGYNVPDSESRSWRNSLRAVKDVFEFSKFNDHGIILEYQLPLSSKRIDCLICGRDSDGNDQSVIIELKQWEKCQNTESDKVLTFVGGGNREVLHPSVQVGQYREYLENNLAAFYEENPIILNSCVYLHNYNYNDNDALLDEKFEQEVINNPIFASTEVSAMSKYLSESLENGNGMTVLKRIEESKYAPNKKLLQNIKKLLKKTTDIFF